ncbi:BTAD domain-containing putative transcriptional regulator [Micromonospora sp. NBC_00860]|uniref:BTAD domain-containing putative transcriptional regulator n=1 Tax=Micromonospora sp. NBC_00860 TaxID=2975980 RepID=UPI0038665985|nr:LysM peptidoglycan-binding domain-containing protein [Micromonospora sp. NBC_00860]
MRFRGASAAHTSAVTLLVVAVPVTLVRLGRWPRPQGSWTTLLRGWVEEPLSGGFLAGIAYLAAWLLWAMLAAAITARLYAQAARMSRRLPRLHMPGPLQGITAAVLGATAVSTAATATPAHATATTAAAETTHAPQGPAATARTHADDQTTSPANGKDQAEHTYTVRRGDTLSRIAQDRLGDADRWPEIFTANRGTRFPHTGGTLRDPDLIYPGWTLRLPPTLEAPRPSPRPAPAPTPTTSAPSGPSSSPTGTDTDDGLVESAPAPTSAPADHASASGPAATPTTRTADDRTAPTPRPQPGVSLGTGSWLDMGLAAAVLAAVALVWAHRRRRYIPQQPTARPRLDDPSVEAMPAVVTRIRRGLRALTPSATTIPDPGPDLDPPPDEAVVDADSDPADAADNATYKLTAHGSQSPIPPPARPLIEVLPSAGLGLIGPGAQAAARGALVSALAAGGPDDPDSRHHVVIASDTLATLLGTTTTTLADTLRMTITSGLSDALTLIEERTLHRARMCGDHELDTITDLRDRDPTAEPVPPTVLIAAPTATHERTRIAALLTQGHRLDIHGVLLGAWPDGDTISVAEDGSTSIIKHDAKQHSCPSAVGRLSVINRSETTELLRLLAESHTGEPQPPAPAQHTPLPATVDENSSATPPSDKEAAPRPGPRPANAGRLNVLTPPQSVDIPAEVQPSEPRALVPTAPPRPVIGQGPRPAANDMSDPDRLVSAAHEPNPTPENSVAANPHQRCDHAGNEPHPAGDDRSSRTGGRVDVRVLGGARIVDMDTTTPLRAKALELLVYLIVQDGDAAQDNILDDLLPDAPASKAPHRLHTYVSALRKTLILTGGPATYLTHPSRRYALNRDALDTDLWRMRAALRDAALATTDADRTAALQRAVNAYDGTLADGFDYEWIEAYREGIRRQALDAHLALAAATTDPTQALAVLEAAMRHDPYAEAIYQQAMRAHAALGHLEQIRSLRRALTRRLDEIDAEPSEDTLRLADRLIADLRRQKPTGKTDFHNSGLHP